MLRRTISEIVLTLLLVSVFVLAFDIQPVRAETRIWIVDDDGPAHFHKIQEAIDAAASGDTIFVRVGTYIEHVVVNKTVSLVGEDKSNTIIDGEGRFQIIEITTSNASISGFTVRNGDQAIVVGSYSGNSYGNIIRNCILKEANFGIELLGEIADAHMPSGLNVIERNTIETTYAIGLHDSDRNKIADNIIKNGAYGISVDWYSHDNLIVGNLFQNIRSRGEALTLTAYRNTTIIENTFKSNDWGLFIYGSTALTPQYHIYHNNFVNNVRQVELLYDPQIVWDDGYPSGGNYWSNYTGVDSDHDGIGDTPHIIDSNNIDNYPLMGLFSRTHYTLTITTSVGGTTNPSHGAFTYAADSSVQVIAIPNADYIFDYWELDTANVGSANPYTVLMDNNHTLRAVFTYSPPPPPPLSASIYPPSASIDVGQFVTFNSAVTGGYAPYSYEWCLNGALVSGANQSSWVFTPTTSGIYYVYLNVTDQEGTIAQSDTALVTVTTVPVGGYSIPIYPITTAKPSILYLIITVIVTIAFTAIIRKTTRKTKHRL